MSRILLWLSAAAMVAGWANLAPAGQVYWSDRDGHTIWRGDMDGGGTPHAVLDISDGLSTPQGLGLDLVREKLYFADSGTKKIRRANLDGSGVEDLVTTGMTLPADLELDPRTGRVYWTDMLQGEIRSADLDGGNVKVVWSGLNLPYFFDLDTAAGKIYWAENANTVVYVANADGTGGIQTLDIGQIQVRDVAVDHNVGKIYWGDRESHTLQRANLDGSGVQTLFDATDGLSRPHGVEIDTTAGMVYWADTRRYSVNRARMDGSGAVEVLYDGLTDAWDLELMRSFDAGDVDRDGDVDIFDVAVLQVHYGTTSGATWADGDFNGNGTVDIFDVAAMQVNYGRGVASAPAAVPEPSTLVLAGMALASLLACIRRPRRWHRHANA